MTFRLIWSFAETREIRVELFLRANLFAVLMQRTVLTSLRKTESSIASTISDTIRVVFLAKIQDP